MKSATLSKSLYLLVVVAALTTGIWFGTRYFAEPVQSYKQLTVLTTPRALGPFEFTDHTGNVFNRESLRGHWTFIFFGYTHCPDICPNTMGIYTLLDKALKATPGLHDKTRFVLVSVDPERDSPEVMADYVSYYNPNFIGLTETQKGNLLALSTQLGAVYLVHKPQTASDRYTVDHSPNIVVIDPDAQLHAVISPPHDPAAILEDFLTMTGTTR